MITVKLYQDNLFLDAFTAETLNIKRELNAVDTFDFRIDSAALKGSFITRVKQLQAIVVVDGVGVMQGFAQSINLTDDGQYEFRCNSLLTELTQIRSKSNAAYQDQQLVAILLDLLTYAPGWALGNIVTMEDFLVKTTIDLRGEKRLFSQIIKLIESTPNVFLREGANRTIELGVFNKQTHPFIPTAAVQSLEVETTYSDLTYQIESYGGSMDFVTTIIPDPLDPLATQDLTTHRSVTLADALAGTPALATDPNFPIVYDKGVLVVRNIRDDSAADGGEYTDVFSEITPVTTENPSDTEIQQAGYALWLKTCKELEDRKDNTEAWSGQTSDIPFGFRVGDRVFIHASASRLYHDQYSGALVRQDIGTVSKWFRVPSFQQRYSEKGLQYNLDLSEGLQLVKIDPILALYDAASSPLDANFSDNALALNQYAVLTATLNPGLEPDCYNTDDLGFFDGRTLTIPLGTVPMGATGVVVYGNAFSDNETAKIRLVSPPALPSTNPIVCVSINRTWTNLSTLTVYLLVKYT